MIQRLVKPAKRMMAAAMLLAWSAATAGVAADNVGPTGPSVISANEAVRKACDEAMAEQTARLRSQRPAASGLVPPAPVNPEGGLPSARPDPATLEAVEQRRSERAARASFTPGQMLVFADRPSRQPDHIRDAPRDDPRLIRARLFAAPRERQHSDRPAPGIPGSASELEGIAALRREIDRQTGNTHVVPSAPETPPNESVSSIAER